MKQRELSEKTGIVQPDISRYLKDIANGNVLRKPIEKVLRAQGVKEITVEIGGEGWCKQK
jgi:hypothetical protein